jgi:hypothetical protein
MQRDGQPPTAAETTCERLAEGVATMLRAMRLGDFTTARTHGLVALARYASEAGTTVGELLNGGDFGELAPSRKRPRVVADPVLP